MRVLADLQAQLHATAVASACSADLENIASLHRGIGWRDRRRAYGQQGCRENCDKGEGSLECNPGIGIDNGRRVGLSSGLADRRLPRRRLHDPMQEMQVILKGRKRPQQWTGGQSAAAAVGG
eukprot:1147663-Pelagomonas_calceolata.AAC.3